MNNQKIQEIVGDFFEGNAAAEIIPCIFHVTLVAAAEKPLESISENDQKKMITLLSFIMKLDREVNAANKISRESLMHDLDQLYKQLESGLSDFGVFLNDDESFKLMQRIRNLTAEYKTLIEFIKKKSNP